MATYLSRSNAVQTESLQTLYLLNPSSTGYSDSSKQGSMVLISPTSGAVGQGNSLGNSGQQQQEQHYNEFSLPLPGLTQLPLSQQFHIAAVPYPNMGHLNAPSNVFSSHLSNYGYSWNVGSEVLFSPSRDVTNDNQPLPAQINFMNSGQQSTSELCQYDLRTSQTSLQDQPTLIPNGIALGLNMGNLQASSGAGQILSLSLTPQQPSAIPPFPIQHSGTTVNSCSGFSNASIDGDQGKMDRVPNKCMEGSLSSFRGFSGERILGTSYQNQANGAGSNRLAHMMSGSLPIEVYGSKYLRAAQQLLDEMVSIGSGLKRNTFKYAQLLSSMGPSSMKDGSFSKGRVPAENNGNHGQPVVTWSKKDVASTVTALPSHTEGIPEHTPEIDVQIGQAGRQELQMKKAKLMSMLNEVDQRYKEYYQQMQIVVASFESAAGLGAARTYTALALQTISKNFRCLRDAIHRQIRVTCRALGEEEFSGHGRREASHLSSADQQLLHQNALQQFGMMQQHAWRPQRGLPERAVSVLRTWLFEHFLHPYPKDSDKLLLARQTGLSRNQVSNWFINARVRLWKPMVEEMYSEEIREEDVEEADKPAQNGGELMNKGLRLMDSTGNSDSKKWLQGSEEEFAEQGHGSNLVSDMHQSKTLIGSSSENLFFCERETVRQGVKKARTENPGSALLLSPDSSINMDRETDEALTKGTLGHDIAIRTELRQENYGFSNNGCMKTDHQNIGVYGTLQINGLNRLPQEGLTARCAANSGVSLTLGLQHRDGFMSVSGAQQHYTQGQGQFVSAGRQQDCGGTAVDYYSTRGNAGRHTSSYEAMNLQHEKQFATRTNHQDRVE